MKPPALLRLRRHSLRTQLVLWNVLALGILFAALGVIIHYTVLSTIMASVDAQLDTQTRPLLHGGRPGRPPNDQNGPPPSADDPLGGFGSPPQDHNGPPNDQNGPPNDQNGSPPNGPDGENGPPFGDPNGPQGPDGHPPDGPPFEGPGRPTPNPYHPRRYDRQGHSLERYDAIAPWDPRAVASVAQQGKAIYTRVVTTAGPLRVYTCPFPDRGPVQGVIQAAYPLTDVNRAVSGLNRALLLLIPVALLCAGFGGTLLTDRVLRRVRLMSQAAGQISAQNFSERLPVTGQDEFSELAATFNAMLGRLQSAFEQQRRFTADASHELKTPLTIIKGNTSMTLNSHPEEAGYRQSLQEIDGAADTMGRLVQDLLLLARSDSGQAGRDRRDVLLHELLSRALARVPRKDAAPIAVTVADETLQIHGNEDELVRLFANLLDNAVRHTPPDGEITITARRDGDFTIASIADTGPGLAPEHLPHLGERFYRADHARARPDGGTGLGLSICKSIIEAHGGTLTFDSQVGVGTTVTVRLPAA